MKMTSLWLPEWLKTEIDIAAEQLNMKPSQALRIAAFAFTKRQHLERLRLSCDYDTEQIRRGEQQPGDAPGRTWEQKFKNLTSVYLDEMIRADGDPEKEKVIEAWYEEAKKELDEERKE